MNTNTAVIIISELNKAYPHSMAERNFLKFDNPYQILIMTILSAQTTDATVNGLKDELFFRYPTPQKLALADILDVEGMIHPAGFYHMKAKNIIGAAQCICNIFDGEVPRTIDELITLPGVGRKTANIVTNHAFNDTQGIAVDTHVKRLSQRIGFTNNDNPSKIEQDLLQIFPKKWWEEINYLLIRHGREICCSRKPKCEICIICSKCRYFQKMTHHE